MGERRRLLTVKQLERWKTDPERAQEIVAGLVPGLFAVVQKSGRRGFVLRYRFRGRTRKLTLRDPETARSDFPALSLATARNEAGEALRMLANGVDPATKPEEPVERPPDTVRVVAAEWLERKVKHERTRAETERILRKDILPALGGVPIVDVRKVDVLRLTDSIADRGAGVAANRTLSLLKRFFNWSIERGHLEASPADGIRAPGVERDRDRVLSDGELTEIWRASENLGYPFAPYFRLLVLLGQRRAEIARIRWDDLDLEKAIWTIPREMTKADREHWIPLAPPAMEILETLPRFDGGPFALSTTGGKKPIGGFSKAKSRLDETILEARKAKAAQLGKNSVEVKGFDWRVHDIRRTVASGLAALKTPSEVLAKILNHSMRRVQGVTSIYNRFDYAAERREALEKWSEHVLSLIAEVEAADARHLEAV
jgi:integrase